MHYSQAEKGNDGNSQVDKKKRTWVIQMDSKVWY